MYFIEGYVGKVQNNMSNLFIKDKYKVINLLKKEIQLTFFSKA